MNRLGAGKLAGAGSMKRVIRENVKIDRIAFPPLTQHLIDPSAESVHVPANTVLAVAEHEAAIPCDVPLAFGPRFA